MRGIQFLLQKKRFGGVPLVLVTIFSPLLQAADPVINVAWEDFGTPQEGIDYRVSIDPPATPAFPDVELLTGSLTWQIWSTDTEKKV